MTASLLQIDGSSAPIDWTISVDADGQREYAVTWQVQTTNAADGPDIALTCPGLPVPGSHFSVGNSYDPWAFYQRKGSARLHDRMKSAKLWDVTINYSTRPARRCMDSSVQDPLLEPARVSGGFNKFTRRAVKDTSGNALVTTGNEPILSGVEIDDNRPTVRLEMNVAWVNLSFVSTYVDTVNNATWWSCAARTIKCSEFNWERVLYGTCRFYYRVQFTFELKRDTWDFVLANYGRYKKVTGSSPARYVENKDEYENVKETWLDINGAPTITPTWFDQTSGALATKRVYQEKNFAAVGWPAVIL
jgi:hypothetical protein